jgi:uncharacterized membrane protein
MEQFGEGLARGLTRHWLLLVNGALLLIAGLAVLAPYLAHSGHPFLALILFRAFRLLCHQKPERCFFVFGHQMALCSRCFAIYTSFLTIGLAFGAWRTITRRRWEEIPLWALGILAIPMAIDGLTQLAGLRESTQALRTITGTLVGAGVGLFVYPFLARAFQETRAVGKKA